MIRFIVADYVLDCFIISLVAACVAVARAPRPLTAAVVIDRFLAWYVLFNIGMTYLVNSVFHSVFGAAAAAFIGWADSPFQLEVATASLGFSVGGFVSAFAGFDRRLVAITGPSIFSLGARFGHIYQMVTAHNFAPGNAGVIFYLDFIIPLFGLALLLLQRRGARGRVYR